MHYHAQPFQVGRMTGPQRREMNKKDPDVFQALEIDLPSGTRYYAASGAPIESRRYLAKVTASGWPTYTEGFDPRASALGATEYEIEIADTDADRDLANESARYPDRIKGSAFRLYPLATRNASLSDWLKFSGVLRDAYMVRPFVWKVLLGPQDDALQNGYVPEGAITKGVFPNSHQNALSQYPAIIYGVHSSQGFTAQGFVPTLYVDTVGFVYLVAIGKISVPRVFKDGVQQSSGYAITYPIYGGRRFTAIDFTSDQVNASVTADVEGLTDNPDGGGTLISNRADQLKHFLANFVFNAWQGQGVYYNPASGPIDLRFFALCADFFRDHSGYDGSRWIGGSSQKKALDELNDWAAAAEMRLFWTHESKIAPRPLDYRPPVDPYCEEQVIKLGKDDPAAFSQQHDGSAVFQKISLQSAYGQVAGRFFNETLVTDLSAGAALTDSKQDPWSKATVA